MKLSGLEIANRIKEELLTRPKPPGKLAIVQVGDNPVSSLYVKKKQEFAQELGLNVIVVKTDSEEIEDLIKKLSFDQSIKGMIVQLPLPKSIKREKVLSLIPKEKDVDGFHFILGNDYITYPPTVLAIKEILTHYRAPLEKGVLIVGGGFLVGKPLSKYFAQHKVKSEILEKDDKNYEQKLKSYDTVVVATGGGRVFEEKDFKPGAYIIDASTVAEEQKIRGDVANRSETINLAGVPGGVGPITVAELFKNFFIL